MRKLSTAEIRALCENKQIQDTFIGSSYTNKQPKQKWNKDYLERLYYAVVAESFNQDYLLYLYEVADFVAKAKIKKVVIAGVVIVVSHHCGSGCTKLRSCFLGEITLR